MSQRDDNLVAELVDRLTALETECENAEQIGAFTALRLLIVICREWETDIPARVIMRFVESTLAESEIGRFHGRCEDYRLDREAAKFR
jgi:hypothetical protein